MVLEVFDDSINDNLEDDEAIIQVCIEMVDMGSDIKRVHPVAIHLQLYFFSN